MTGKVGYKIAIFLTVIFIAFFLLFVRLYYLQIIHGNAYLQRSESNFIQERIIKHSRGKILDKEGRALADNRLAYDVYVTFAMLPDSMRSLRALSHPLNISSKDLVKIDKELMLKAESDGDGKVELKTDASLQNCKKVADIARTKMITGIEIENFVKDKQPLCKISLTSKQFPSQAKTFALLLSLLGVEKNILDELWQKTHKKAQGLGRFKPSLLVSDIGFDAYARIENAISLGSLAGVTVVPSQRRRYVHGNFATHVIGYLGQVSLADLQEKSAFYRSGDFIGRNGIEASFEDVLRGIDGIDRVVVDAKGRRFDDAWEQSLLGSMRTVAPRPGDSIKLSIDYDLQRAAQDLFNNISGSVVVSEVDTGFILAMASFPGFDPNGLVSADNSKFFKMLLSDKSRPLRNKAVQDHYSPGSIFKPITAIAGLSRKLINPSYRHYCSGVYQIHRTSWRCFKREGHGPISLRDALKVSCDGFFYELGHRLTLEPLAETAEKLGFGQKTQIALLGETSGILPNREYYKRRLGYVAPGFVVNMAIGQGDLSVSPIQVAMAYGAIANGGTVFKPQIVQEILNDQGQVVKKFESAIRSSVADSSYNFEEILQGLSYVTEAGGSAHSLRYKPEFADINKWLNDEKITVVGKTGTAQVVKLSKTIKHLWNVDEVPYEQRDHAWFVALYPPKAPKIVVVVMVEHGGFAGSKSAPIAVRLMKSWHDKNISKITS